MEEAEHALWRAAGLTVAERGRDLGWPRVSAAFEFRAPLHFEEEFEVHVRLAEVRRTSLHYSHTILRDGTTIGTGTMVAVCARYRGDGMKAVEIPAEVVSRLQEVAGDRE